MTHQPQYLSLKWHLVFHSVVDKHPCRPCKIHELSKPRQQNFSVDGNKLLLISLKFCWVRTGYIYKFLGNCGLWETLLLFALSGATGSGDPGKILSRRIASDLLNSFFPCLLSDPFLFTMSLNAMYFSTVAARYFTYNRWCYVSPWKAPVQCWEGQFSPEGRVRLTRSSRSCDRPGYPGCLRTDKAFQEESFSRCNNYFSL